MALNAPFKSRWMRVKETGFEYIEQICANCGKKHAPLGYELKLRHVHYYNYPGIWFCDQKCKEVHDLFINTV